MEALEIRSVDIRFSRIIRMIAYGLKFIGLAPFSIRETTEPGPNNSRKSSCTSALLVSKIGLVYNVLLSILVLITGAAATPRLFTMSYPNKSYITQIIDVELAVVRTLTSSVVILSFALWQAKAKSIMNRLLEVDHLLSGMKRDLTGERTSFTFFAVQMTVNTLLWLIFWVSENAYIHSFLHWFIFNVPIVIIYWFVMEYAMVLGVAARELESFNKNLTTFKELLTAHSNVPVANVSPTPQGQLVTLELLHSIRTMLYEVCQDIGDFFSLLILPAVACFTMTIIYNIYYLIIPLVISIDTPPICTAINVVFWILISVFSLVSLSFNVTRTLKQAKQTGTVVHKLLATTRRQQIQTELERFSLQLMHEDLSFTGYGFFSLDFTLMQSIVHIDEAMAVPSKKGYQFGTLPFKLAVGANTVGNNFGPGNTLNTPTQGAAIPILSFKDAMDSTGMTSEPIHLAVAVGSLENVVLLKALRMALSELLRGTTVLSRKRTLISKNNNQKQSSSSSSSSTNKIAIEVV